LKADPHEHISETAAVESPSLVLVLVFIETGTTMAAADRQFSSAFWPLPDTLGRLTVLRGASDCTFRT